MIKLFFHTHNTNTIPSTTRTPPIHFFHISTSKTNLKSNPTTVKHYFDASKVHTWNSTHTHILSTYKTYFHTYVVTHVAQRQRVYLPLWHFHSISSEGLAYLPRTKEGPRTEGAPRGRRPPPDPFNGQWGRAVVFNGNVLIRISMWNVDK